jgi:hypothetical protein
MNTHIERDLRYLKVYALVTTILISILALSAFTRSDERPLFANAKGQKARFDEIDVERINIREPDGKLRMVLSNKPRSQGPLYRGKPFLGSGGDRPGIIFFDDEESEDGGLIFGGQTGKDGNYSAYGHLSFDQFHENQILVLQYGDENGRRHVGMSIQDRPNDVFYDWVQRRDSIRKLPNSTAKTEALRQMERGTPAEPRAAERVYVGRDDIRMPWSISRTA